MELTNFNSTPKFFKFIQESLKDGASQKAGRLWEEFTRERFIQDRDYVEVYDTNNFEKIPSYILTSTNSFKFLSKGAHSFGIDKFGITRHGDIDVIQDKSNLYLDKNLGTDKAAKMMSLRENPLTNIRNFIICTTARDLSHYKNVWENKTPICYGGDYYLPDPTNSESLERDKQFWKNIKLKKQKKPTVDILGFVSRGPDQDDYINNGYHAGLTQFKATGYARWWQLAVGSVGKSVLDPIILAKLESEFNSVYTNTPAPVNVSFYHSTKTLPKNGLEEVHRRRAIGIDDEVIVLSGTNVKEDIKTNFFKTTSTSEVVVRTINSMNKGKSVLILTLYHHAEQVQIVKNLLEKHYKEFKFWYRKRDETDYACKNKFSVYAPAFDDRTQSVLTFGSSGTEHWGNPTKDYGTNNIDIHGECTHRFGWASAEDKKLVKPLKIYLPSVKESEIAKLFPEYVNKEGRVDWNIRVDGIAVENEYPTMGLIADIICLIKTLQEQPQIKRMLGFALTRKQNKLAEVNFLWVANKILKNDNNAKRIKKYFFQTLNDDFDNSTIQNHDWAIKEAKSHDHYVLQACKVFSRGYDDTITAKGGPYKHHAGIHWDKKNIVDTVQEIWRFTRTDANDNDPFAHYILPLRYNDLSDEPSWSEERLRIFEEILIRNQNIFTEFESISQCPGSARKKRERNENNRIWIPENFDVEHYSNLVTTVARNSKGIIHQSLFVEAHTWLLTEYMKLPALSNHDKSPISKQWCVDPKWKPIRDMYALGKTNPALFRGKFWSGDYAKSYGVEIEQQIENNLLTFKLHENKLKEKHELLEKLIAKDYYNMAINALDKDPNFWRGFSDKVCEKYKVPPQKIYKAVKETKKNLVNDIEHWKKQKLKVYDLIFEEAKTAVGIEEWIQQIKNRWKETNIQGSEFIGHLPRRFLVTDFYNVLDQDQKEKLDTLRKEVSRKAHSRLHKGQTPWNKNIQSNKNSKKYQKWIKQVQKGRDLAKKKGIYMAAKRSRNPQ